MRRVAGTLLLVVAVALAGCTGVFGGSDEPTATLTPAAVPTDQPTPTPVAQFAPGLTGQGIENASALVEAHVSVLQNRSFATKSTTRRVAPNGTVTFRVTDTFRAGPPNEGWYFVSGSNESDTYRYDGADVTRIEAWSNGRRTFLRRTYANGTTAYDRRRVGNQRQFRATGVGLRYVLGSFGTANTVVTKRNHDGTTRYLVRGSVQNGRQGNVHLRLVVDGRGIVHRYRTVRRPPAGENGSRIVTETRILGVGRTHAPQRPSWVDAALNRTTSTRLAETTAGE